MEKIKTKLEILKARKLELLQRTTPSQRNAEKKIKRIAIDVFGFNVKSERIFRPYILDIYIQNIKVGIEIDGGVHNKKESYDDRRDQFLWDRHGVKVYRFTNDEVKTKAFKQAIFDICLDGVNNYLSFIKSHAENKNLTLPLDFPKLGNEKYFKGKLAKKYLYEDINAE